MPSGLNKAASLWIALWWGILSLSLTAEEVVIVHPATATVTFSATELTNVLQGKQAYWRNGKKIVLVMPKTSSGAESGLKKYAGFTVDQFTNHWKRLVFTGKGIMPWLVTDDIEAVKVVRSTPDSLALIDKATVTNGVKVLAIK
jgi:hypothetical protein